MTQLERLTIKLGAAADQQVIALLLEDAEQDFLTYTGRNEVPAAAGSLIEDMVIYKYNQLDNKGIASQSYSGISETYTTDYDTALKTSLNRWRKIKLL